ncbi:muscleblind-like protein 3 isoform X4 [Ptychodera flava]|uniref:muscleblind-like protein 3 isoform X4 n=1 Tax=Ptychodera flava TaxID=63121 RepID=UPI00396A8EDB
MALRDNRWLTLEVCREFQRGTCTRPDTECKFAHPSKSVTVENGRVTACFDSLKGKCTRENCKYLHPPAHLKSQLEINGRNNLAAQKMLQQLPFQPLVHGPITTHVNPQYVNSPPVTTLNPYHFHHTPTLPNDNLPLNVPGLVPTPPIMTPQKLQRNDRLEVCREFQRGNCTRGENDCKFAHPGEHVTIDTTENGVTVCMDYIKGRCSRDKCKYFHPPPHLQARIKAAQHQASQASAAAAAAAMLPTTPDKSNKKRARDPADEIILALPGMIPLKKGPGMFQGANTYQQALASFQFTQPSPFVQSPFPMMTPIPTAGAQAASVPYYNAQHQLAETLPVCRDFKAGNCKRPNCRYVHLTEDYVEVIDGKVTLCRYAAQGRCTRPKCKFYHLPTVPSGASVPTSIPVPVVTMTV